MKCAGRCSVRRKVTSVVSERDPVGKLGAVGQERDEDCAGERNQQDEGENDWVECVHHLSASPSS